VVWLWKHSSASVKNFLPNAMFRHALPHHGRSGNSRAARLQKVVLVSGSPNLLLAFGIVVLVFSASLASSQTAAPSATNSQSSARSANQIPTKKTNGSKAASPNGTSSKVAVIKSYRIIQEKDGPAVEILSTNPLVPAIQQIENPLRLVIDLPNARLDAPQKRTRVEADQISSIRADQFQQNPPVARVVLDLLAPRTFTWDAAGNRLVIHLGKTSDEASRSPFQAPTTPSLTSAPQPVVKAIRTAGPLALSTNAGNVGSSFTAGADTAVLTLSSGGEVRVCPGTTLSITSSQTRHNLLLGMSTGALETHLSLDATSDSVMTPDFWIMLTGPGEFHYAFSADNQGNTCVRALPGNTASAIVTELIGDRTYQVKATDQLVFHGGQLDRVDMAVPLECGCPPPRQTTQQAVRDLPEKSSTASSAPPPEVSPAPVRSAPVPDVAPASGIPAQDMPPTTTGSDPASEVHVQVTAPLVFHATGPPPAPVESAASLPLDSHRIQTPELDPAPPPGQNTTAKAETNSSDRPRGFFHKLGRFFSAMFR
jgi:hypothetical protein